MNYQQLTLPSTRETADGITEVLAELGALAVTLTDAEDQPIFAPGVGEFPLWDHVLISALFAEDTDMQAIITVLNPQKYEITLIPDQAWEHTWKDDFHRQCYNDRLWIYPSWDVPETRAQHSLILDPGMAFGTGKHQTTHLCLQWLAETIHDQDLVIDYGCGSGILALSALTLGAKNAIAIDIDTQALDATRQNAEQNHLSLQVVLPDQVLYMNADIVIANILANPLIELAPTLASLVKPDGLIALSGILTEQADKVSEAYAPWLTFEAIRHNEEWVLLIGRKRQ
ncbi:MAG: 50S ribosomal protein L11 methyltransferase [Pseudomonadota bacterium]|nr:50S ribosomal protein L11 methyltransferase [Pseudomonadota bacterium]